MLTMHDYCGRGVGLPPSPSACPIFSYPPSPSLLLFALYISTCCSTPSLTPLSSTAVFRRNLSFVLVLKLKKLLSPLKKEMEKLAQLYLENYIIMQDNERLRKAADQLNQENQALLNELKQRLAAAAAAGKPIPDINLDVPATTSGSKASKRANK